MIMNNLFRKTMTFLLIAVFAMSSMIKVNATSIDLVEMTPNVQIRINMGDTTITEAFLEDLKDELVAKGIDISKLDITFTGDQTFNPADTSQWDIYDHIGDWEERASSIEDGYYIGEDYYDYNWDTDHYYYPNQDPGNDGDFSNDPHIIPSADGGTLYFYGYGEPAYNDFMLSLADSKNDKQILFTIDESSTTYHTLFGAGFLINAKIVSGLVYAYAILSTEDDIQLLKIDGVDLEDFHDNTDIDTVMDLDNVSLVETFVKPDVTVHNFEVNIKGTVISITDNGDALESIPQDPLGWDAMEAYYASLNNTYPLMSNYWWDSSKATYVMNGYKETVVSITQTMLDTVDSADNNGDNPAIWSYLVLNGYQVDGYNYSYDDTTSTYTVTVSDNNRYHSYLTAVGETYTDAIEYLATKGIIANSIDDEKYFPTANKTAISYELVTSNWVNYGIMDETIAAQADLGVDITNMNDYWLVGSNLIWEYYTDDYYELTIPIIDLDPDFVAKSSENYTLTSTFGNRFGPLVSYTNHGCEDLTAVMFSDLLMNLKANASATLEQTAADQVWSGDSKKFFINLEDKVLTGLNEASLGANLYSNDVSYIGVGSSASLSQHAEIALEAGKGYSIVKTDAALISKIADYIYPIVKAGQIENVIKTYPVETSETFDGGEVIAEGLDSAVDILDDLLAGDTVALELNLETFVTENVPAEDKTLVDDYLKTLEQAADRGVFFIDVSLIKIVTGEGGSVETEITQTLKPITITIVVPENMRGKFEYKMVRIHDGVLEELKSTYDAETFTLTFVTDRFSTYGVTFSNVEIANTGDGTVTNVFGLVLAGAALYMITKKKKKIA